MRDAEKPPACRKPISRRRCSMPSLKKSAVKHQRRDHQEETEVKKVFAEVGGAARSFQSLPAAGMMNPDVISQGSLQFLSDMIERLRENAAIHGMNRSEVNFPKRDCQSC